MAGESSLPNLTLHAETFSSWHAGPPRERVLTQHYGLTIQYLYYAYSSTYYGTYFDRLSQAAPAQGLYFSLTIKHTVATHTRHMDMRAHITVYHRTIARYTVHS